MSPDDSKIVDFPITPEERARRLKAEVERLARQSPTEWMFWLDGAAEMHGIASTKLKAMIEATITANEKKARADKAEDRQREQRAEKKQTAAHRESKREQDEQRREQERAAKEEERKRKERAKEFAAIAKLPRLAHEIRLAELAKRLGEDLDFLREEFAAYYVPADTDTKPIEPWDEPVDTHELLIELEAQLRRYVVLHDDAAIAVTLWAMFAWVHEIATHSPLLVATSAEPDSGKSTLLGGLGFLTPRSYFAVEMTGPNVYRLVDHLGPTLIVDEADQLFHRKTDLMHIINSSWTKGAKIPRMVRGGEIHEFDPFCPKAIGMKGLALPDTTASRAIVVKLWPKLPSEQTADFRHVDDDEFVVLRRKCMRWAANNAAALKDANPAMPPGFSNRLAMNWRLLLAVADLAGGVWPKRAREAAIKLSSKRHRPSEGIRLITALYPMFAVRREITSADLVAQLNADPSGEWCDFRGRGPITQRQVAALLKDYEVFPIVLHPTKRADLSRHGYRREQFAVVFDRLLLHDQNIRTLHGKEPRKKTRRRRK